MPYGIHMYEHVVQACSRHRICMVKVKNKQHEVNTCNMRLTHVKSKNSSKSHNTTPFLPSKDSRLAMDYFAHGVDNGSGNLSVQTSFPTIWPRSTLYGG